MKRWRAGILAGVFAVSSIAAAGAQTLVPPGNRNLEQPVVSAAAAKRTRDSRSSFEAKYEKIRDLLAEDAELRGKIEAAAAEYGIDPLHIVGALVGEHTYNVDALDRLQTYYVKSLAYLNSGVAFEHAGESVADFVSRPQFERCGAEAGSDRLWSCREAVWEAEFRGRTVDGQDYPDDRFGAVFFQPFYAGQTFGLGQLNPLTALKASDLAHAVSGHPRLSAEEPGEVYRAIMDPDRTLALMAAVLKTAIEDYRAVAGFDISQNPGITATLYNVGDSWRRAAALKAENDRRQASGEPLLLPQENYYGWLVNDRLEELRAIFG